MNHQYSPTTAAALILSPDPLTGALVGAAVELAGLRAMFMRSGESSREVLGRTHPAVVLVDFDAASTMDEALLGPAMMMGARLTFFGSAARAGERDIEQFAARYHARVIVFPRDFDVFCEILASGAAVRREQLQG